MLILRATGDLLRVQATTTGSSIKCHVSAIEADNGTPPIIQDIVRTNTAFITDTTLTTILDCTTANRRRNVKHVNIFNDHATVATIVTVTHTDGTTIEVLAKANLLVGESLVFTQGGLWIHYDSNGAPYPSVGNAASQAEMEAGTATDRYVTPQGVNWHPGTSKFWVVFTGNSTTITASWNMTSITDGSTQATVTIATDFSGSAWCLQATAIGSAVSVAACRLSSAITMAAGSIIVFCVDGAATTALQDPTTWCVSGFGDQ